MVDCQFYCRFGGVSAGCGVRAPSAAMRERPAPAPVTDLAQAPSGSVFAPPPPVFPSFYAPAARSRSALCLIASALRV